MEHREVIFQAIEALKCATPEETETPELTKAFLDKKLGENANLLYAMSLLDILREVNIGDLLVIAIALQ